MVGHSEVEPTRTASERASRPVEPLDRPARLDVGPMKAELDCLDGQVPSSKDMVVFEAFFKKRAAAQRQEHAQDCKEITCLDSRQQMGAIFSETASTPARQRADLDGDGRHDTVEIVVASHGPEVGLLVEFATGATSVLGAGHPTRVRFGGPSNQMQRDDEEFFRREEWPDMDQCDSDYKWLEGWDVLKRNPQGDLVLRLPGRKQLFYQPPGAVGDGLLVDSGDQVAIYYFDGLGWRWVHAGM
jgi:hypothetical protein